MPLPHSLMQQEISRRLARVRAAMREKSYDALIVYGDNKVRGSLRYLTDYFPDRAGWVSLGATETYLFEGAAFVLSKEGEGVLLCDPGLTPSKEVFADKVVTGGFGRQQRGWAVGVVPRGAAEGLEGAARRHRDVGSFPCSPVPRPR